MAKKYTKREISIIFTAFTKQNLHIDEIVGKLRKAGFDRSKSSVRCKLRQLRFKRTKPGSEKIYKSKWDVAKDFIFKYAKHYTIHGLSYELSSRFGLEVTNQAIYSYLARNKLKCKSLTKDRRERQVPVREVGKVFKQRWGVKRERVWFIKYKKNTPPMPLHRYNWLQEYGEIPKTHVVVFKDGNKDNIKLGDCSNLELLPKSKQTIGKRWRNHIKKEKLTSQSSQPKAERKSIIERYLTGDAFI